MKSTGVKSLLSLVRILVNIGWYGYLVVAVVIVVSIPWRLGSQTYLSTGKPMPWMEHQPGYSITFSDAVSPEAFGRITQVFSVTGIPAFVINLLIVYNLRKLLAGGIENPFTLENARRIRVIGFLMLATVAAEIAVNLVIARFVINNVHIPGASIRANPLPYRGGFFSALLVLILSEVFKLGVLLQQEHDLTV